MLIPIHILKQMLADLPNPENIYSDTLRMRVPLETEIGIGEGENVVPVNHIVDFRKERVVREGNTFTVWAIDIPTTLG